MPTAITDFWVNAVDPRRFLSDMAWIGGQAATPPGLLANGSFSAAKLIDDNVAIMDRLGIGRSVLNTGLMADGHAIDEPSVEQLLELTEPHADRFLLAAMPDCARDPVGQSSRVRELAMHPRMVLLRVVPMLEQVPINDRLFYPLYTACAEVGLVVSINVGLPGYAVRDACQHPELLPDVLCDFPGLSVVAAHMGHPYEALLVAYMRRWPNLRLATTMFWPRDIATVIRDFMARDGRGRIIWGSDMPALDSAANLAEVDLLDLDDASRAEYLGGAWDAALALAKDH